MKPGKPVQVWLPTELAEALRDEAHAERRTQSDIVRAVLARHFRLRARARDTAKAEETAQ